MPVKDGYFLSAENPLATTDQRDLEALALDISRLPAIARAKEQSAARWKIMVGRDVPAEAWARFDELIEEWAYHYILKAVNSDAGYPRVLGNFFGAPHEWFGMKVPGTRASVGDNPDSNQIVIPIDAHGRFELDGELGSPAVVDTPFILTGNIALSMTLASLDWQDVRVDAGGRFRITLDPQPANGRTNHIQTKPDARYLFIRDCRSDWRQVPNAYRVQRLDPPPAPPLSVEQMAERAAHYMVWDVPMAYFVIRALDAFGVNSISPPFNTGGIGGLTTQMVSMGRLKLAEDEAYVVTVRPGGARVRNIVVHDYWFRTFDYWKATCTMNNAQGVANADGSLTYVISMRDPDIHNWLDTVGCGEVLVTHRWQGLPGIAGPEGAPAISGQLVKLRDLDGHLPADVARVDATGRRQQIEERQQGVALRYIDR